MPPALTLSFAPQDPADDPRRLAVVFAAEGGAPRRVSFASSGPPLRRSGDALLCLGLLPAMELGCDLVIDGVVSPPLLANADAIQGLLCEWYPGHRRIPVRARAGQAVFAAGRVAGVFFSAGVDSSFTLAETRPRLGALVTLIGADVPAADARQAGHLRAVARAVGDESGLETIIVETDLREVSDRLIGWVEYHGAALAAVRHLLADRLDHALIASSADESSWTRPWGSHPALDPLFGFPGASIEHHGLVHRLAKIERLLREPALMRRLRVCDVAVDNCGVCEDCTFMMRALATLDGFAHAPTFPPPPPGAGRLRVTGRGSRSDLAHLRAAALARGRAPALVAEIDAATARFDRRRWLERFVPLTEWRRRFKRWKRRWRWRRAARRDRSPSPA